MHNIWALKASAAVCISARYMHVLNPSLSAVSCSHSFSQAALVWIVNTSDHD